MSFILETLTNPNQELLTKTIAKFELSNHKNSPCYDNGKSEEIEKNLLRNIIKHTIGKKSRLHVLYDERDGNSIPCALIALNFEIVGSFSALCIDFIFISKSYRRKVFSEINSKISFYLLNFALQEAMQMNEISQLDAVILSPINECVKEVYIEFGFEEFDDGWMYLLIDDI